MKLYLKGGRIIQGEAANQCIYDIKQNETKLKKEILIIGGKTGFGVFTLSKIDENEPIGIYPGLLSICNNEMELPFVGEYHFCFPYKNQLYSYDGTTSSIWCSDIVKYLNHCSCGLNRNVKHRLMKITKEDNPVVVFFTERSVVIGEELRHTYGGANDTVPWYRNCCTSTRRRLHNAEEA